VYGYARFRFLTPFFFVFLGACGSWLFIKIANDVLKKPISDFNIGTFYLSGEPILPHLLFIWSSPNFILKDLAWILVNPGESHPEQRGHDPEQRGHGSSRESRGERCEDRKGFPRWGKSLSFVGTYQCPGLTTFVSSK